MPKIAYHPAYVHAVREGHRFPMAKYAQLYMQILESAAYSQATFFEPQLADSELLCLAHDKAYVQQLLDLTLDERMVRRIGFPLTQELIERELYLVDGTVQASMYALEDGLAFNIAGGTHHSGYNYGEGFCLLNDQAVAAANLLHKKLARRILIIDLDVHQGNGTAHIFSGSETVFTFSMHAEKNYPFVKEASFLDVPLVDALSDADYLALLEEQLNYLFSFVQPDFVFYQAGVDVLATDKLGKLALTAQACAARDALVFNYCRQAAVPIQVSMGGGYSADIQVIVDAHLATIRLGLEIIS